MQSTSLQFAARAVGNMRRLAWRALLSFEKNFEAGIEFFTIGESLIGGDDIIKGEGDVVQEWDKYDYTDFSNRVISMEITRQEDPVSSAALAYSDIEMRNHDNFFTTGAGSSIDGFILPYRPIKLYMGFGEESIPQFVGLTEKVPVLDEKAKIASFHCIDFLSSLYNRPLDESALFLGYRTDEVLEEIMAMVGISVSQYEFDIGFNIIPFVYFKKGDKVGNVVQKLMQAEMGRLYMDETGMIRFKNRQNYSDTITYNFATNNILNAEKASPDSVINVVEVFSKVREVQENQKVWEMQAPVSVPPGQTADIWAEFSDPVSTADDPDYIVGALTSYFAVNTQPDGSGSAVPTDVVLDSSSLFSTSMRMTFENTGIGNAYITDLVIFGTPAKIVKEIYVKEQDDTSVGKYEEHVLTIENDYIQNESDATSLALKLLIDYAEPSAVIDRLEVKGSPAIQIGDLVECNLNGVIDTYNIIKIINRFANAKFSQILTVKKIDIYTYITIGVSTIGGDDVISP